METTATNCVISRLRLRAAEAGVVLASLLLTCCSRECPPASVQDCDCSRLESRGESASPKESEEMPSTGAVDRLMSMDSSGDGTISVEEFREGQKRLFKNNAGWDRALDREEASQYVSELIGGG